VQILSLGITPLIGFAIGKLLLLPSSAFNDNLALGITIACSTPTTISSNVLMTKQGGGNEAAALVNAVIGNVLGVFVSPSLIIAFVRTLSGGSSSSGGGGGGGAFGSISYGQVFTDLTITVIAPLVVGQTVQFLFPNTVKKVSSKLSFPIINSTCLLILVWSVFCDTFARDTGLSASASTLDVNSIISVIFLDLALFLFFSGMAFGVSLLPVFGFDRADSVAIVMCAATKTVALGIPMINIIFGSASAISGLLSIPLLIYHAEQLVVGSVFVNIMKRWVEGVRKEGGSLE
ncbi:hypothetical protein HK102_007635, partial [Quaeritorhiza haematococci]